MNKPRMYHTIRARWETAKHLVQKGKTAEAADLNQLSITEALIEILATLEDIADALKYGGASSGKASPVAGGTITPPAEKPVPSQTGPVKLSSTAAEGKSK